jgi:hypothetical protein
MGRPPVLSGIDCVQCGSDATHKAGISKGKRRFHCRNCGRWFIDPKERIVRPPARTVSTVPDSTLEIRRLNPKSRKGLNRKELPSPSHLVLKLRSIAVRLGRPPTTAEITKLAKQGRSYPLRDYYKVFGSYLAALRKARIKTRYRQQFDESDRARMLGELRALSRRLKRPIYGRDFAPARKKGLVSPVNRFQIAFGTVPNAIALAGVAPKIKYTRDEMIAILRKLDAKLDRPVEKKDVTELNHAGKGPSVNSIVREFGSLFKARRAAGIQQSYEKGGHRTKHWQKYTKEELVVQLKALAKRLGRQPTGRDINRASKEGRCASAHTVSRMFGSLPEAYSAAGFHEPRKREPQYSDKEIVEALLKLKKQLGHFPKYRDIANASKAGTSPAVNTVRRQLGALADLKKKYGN